MGSNLSGTCFVSMGRLLILRARARGANPERQKLKMDIDHLAHQDPRPWAKSGSTAARCNRLAEGRTVSIGWVLWVRRYRKG
jgi:hypothetical protein